MPRTLFPRRSSGGDQHIIPITLGTTSRTAPETPDLAGRPTWTTGEKEVAFVLTIPRTGFSSTWQDRTSRKVLEFSRGRRTLQRSRTCRRNAWDSGCSGRLRCSTRVPLWLDKCLHWPVWQPWHFLTHRSPQRRTTGVESWNGKVFTQYCQLHKLYLESVFHHRG